MHLTQCNIYAYKNLADSKCVACYVTLPVLFGVSTAIQENIIADLCSRLFGVAGIWHYNEPRSTGRRKLEVGRIMMADTC